MNANSSNNPYGDVPDACHSFDFDKKSDADVTD